jgi:hypothetical protein
MIARASRRGLQGTTSIRHIRRRDRHRVGKALRIDRGAMCRSIPETLLPAA